MTFLVELPRNEYPNDAMDSFRAAPDFVLGNARAMMWMSQLAYETAHERKVDDILGAWKLTRRAVISNPVPLHLPLSTACAVAAGGRGATIVAFAGSDPLKINDWITDFRALPSPENTHTGFETAVAASWPLIAAAIAARPAAESAVVFTGHSLGGALAIIAAQRSMREPGVQATAVYTFGSPRPGGSQFAGAYTPALGDRTYRLVHGNDVVSTVPPSITGIFQHVGRCIQCASEGRFDLQTPLLSRNDDKPDFAENVFDSGRRDLLALLDGRVFFPVGPGLQGQLTGILPRIIRDHVPANYLRALAP
jgi:triacylglycerol lipase